MREIVFVVGLVVALYLALCAVLYVKQESLLFFPTTLPSHYHFNFPSPFEERWITASDGTRLHGLLFRAPATKGLVFYLHGNAENAASWGDVATSYTHLGYDVFLLDYRGYGKSQGKVTSQAQLLDDVQRVYQQLVPEYAESKLIILGYSLGTGPAAWLAAQHHPRLLILQAPYVSMQDLATHLYPFVPGVLVRYPLPTYAYIQRVSAPIVLFHGDQDEVIYPSSSVKLQAFLKPTDKLIVLPELGHNGMTGNLHYQRSLAEILAR